MSQTQDPPRPASPFRIQLLDVTALVVGYGLAAVLFRAFWPTAGLTVPLGVFAAGFYLWLGLAMSGPLLLLRHAPHPEPLAEESTIPPAASHERRPTPSRTWAELAWLLIGVYWIVMGVFILPFSLQSFRFGDTVLFGLVPLGAGLAFRLFGPSPPTARDRRPAPWTHHAAVALLASWPLAWLCLIVLGKAML
jgi:hypothetical protein